MIAGAGLSAFILTGRCPTRGNSGRLTSLALLPPEATVTIPSARLPDSAEGLPPDLDGVVNRLADEFPHADEQQIRTVVATTAAGYRDARIRQFVAVFVERESREWLRDSVSVPDLAPVPRGTETFG
jgi:hypothetical protein